MLAMMIKNVITVTEHTFLDVNINNKIDINVIISVKSSQDCMRLFLTLKLQTKLLNLIVNCVIVLSNKWVNLTHKQLKIFQFITAEMKVNLTHKHSCDKKITRIELTMLCDVFTQKSIYKDVCKFLQLNLIELILFLDFKNLLILKT